MWLLRDASIRFKLNALTTSATVLALLVAGAAVIVNDLRMIRASKVEQLMSVATTIGHSSAAALEFMDQHTGKQLLKSFESQKSVVHAFLLDEHNKLFATYPEVVTDRFDPKSLTHESVYFEGDRFLEVTLPIERAGEVIGHIQVRSKLDDLHAQFERVSLILVGVLVTSLFLSGLLSKCLQRAFTSPLMKLVETMRQVSSEGNYQLRVEQISRDEFGVLCQGFNSMLAQIESARRELQAAHDTLELRVEQRTSALVRAKNAAEAASRAKSEFLAKMSHEIRTPMTAILGYAECLLEPSLSENDRRNAISTVCRNGQHLLAVINDILDISKIEAGKMNIERIAAPILPILEDVSSLLRQKSVDKGLAFTIELDNPIPTTIETDPTRLRQILLNLLGNSIKFTDSGFVSLRVRLLLDRNTATSQLEFVIKDSGIGMSSEQVARLFQAFTQGDDSMNRRFGGTGLGLAISRGFARMLGGDIRVDSTSGCGSTFTVTIDIGAIEGVPLVSELAPVAVTVVTAARMDCSNLKLRVLVVEDGPDNQRLLNFILSKAGAEVTIKENGLLGMEAALASRDSDKPFDVILSDMQMPVMDGYEATTKLRLAGYTGPIIAITAHAMADDCQKCLNAGCDDYTTKPINKPKLLQLIHDYADRGPNAKWLGWRPAMANPVEPLQHTES